MAKEEVKDESVDQATVAQADEQVDSKKSDDSDQVKYQLKHAKSKEAAKAHFADVE